MKKQHLIIPAALLGLGLSACNKPTPPAADTTAKPAATPQASLETKLGTAYGFAAKVPADIDGFSDFYNLGKLWSDITQSKTVTAIRQNPLVAQMTSDPSFKRGFDQFQQNPEAAKWRTILADAVDKESFIEFGQGSAAKLAAWVRFNDELRIAQLKGSMGGGKDAGPANFLPALLPYLNTLEIPPMIIGFKLSSQKTALGAELDRMEKNLPPGVELTTFDLGGNSFKSLVAVASKVVPPPQQDALKQFLSHSVTDPKAADNVYQALLARRIEIAYGYIGDYFVASIGSDHAHLRLASNFGASVLGRPEVAAVANYTDKPLLAFSWSSPELIAASQRKLALTPYFQRLKDEISRTMSAENVQKLEADLKRLDAEAAAAFTMEYTPMVGVSFRDHGLHGEAFGGVKATGATGTMKFSTVAPASTFLWLDSVSNPAAGVTFRTWFEDFSATAYDTFQRIGIPMLSNTQQLQFTFFQTQAVPKLTELYRITRDEFSKSLGQESAFALDLNGEIPSLPMIPPPFHDGKIFRFAYLSDVRDRALLGQSWASYLKLTRDIAQMIPQAAMLPGGIPDPGSEVVDGVKLSFYQMPLPTGDLLPNVATTDKTFVMSTSRSYSLDLSKAALKATAPAKPLTVDFRMNFQAAYDFADKWMALAAQYPAIFFQGDQEKADEFKKNQPALSSLLHSLRPLEGMDAQVFEENGVRRVSSAIHWQEK